MVLYPRCFHYELWFIHVELQELKVSSFEILTRSVLQENVFLHRLIRVIQVSDKKSLCHG